jgi:hypothetical protein
MSNGNLGWITFIWGIADDVLEPSKKAVLAMKANLSSRTSSSATRFSGC